MPAPPPFSFAVLLTLVVIVGSSLTMFVLLVRRSTTRRQWVALRDWARQRRFKFRPSDLTDLPPPVREMLVASGPSVVINIGDDNARVMQIQTSDQQRWNVLLRRAPARAGAIAAGLRPSSAAASLLDQLQLASVPSLTLGNRFFVLSNNSGAARALANSASRTLLPQDIGLLVVDEWIVLDFSARPFDPIELDRMLALAQQLSQML